MSSVDVDACIKKDKKSRERKDSYDTMNDREKKKKIKERKTRSFIPLRKREENHS
jgi:hypothetical protein